MQLISPRTTLIIGIMVLAAGLLITFTLPTYDRLGSILLGFGVAATAVAVGKMLARKRPA